MMSLSLVLVSLWSQVFPASAQTAAPLAPPVFSEAFTLSDRTAILDLNRDGSLDIISQCFPFGSVSASLDEEGKCLGIGVNTGLPGGGGSVPTFPSPIAYAAGPIDGDFRDDLVIFSADGRVHSYINPGGTRLDQIPINPFNATVIDDLGQFLLPTALDVSNSFPVMEMVDFDRDGEMDIILAGGQNNYWSGWTGAGFVVFYRNLGNGTFQRNKLDLPGAVVDAEIADLDGDSTPETLVILTETGQVGAFNTEFYHAQYNAGTFAFVGYPITLGVVRVTSFEMADIVGGPAADYIMSQTTQGSSGLTGQVFYQEGDGQGGFVSASWGYFLLPSNLTGHADYIQSIKVVDLDGDQNKDLIAVRGYSSPGVTSSSPQSYAPAELFVFMGPNLQWATPDTIALPGNLGLDFGYNHTVHMQEPQRPLPNLIKLIDLGVDKRPDIFVHNLFQIIGTGATATSKRGIAVLRNTTAPEFGVAAVEKLGEPSGNSTHYVQYKGMVSFPGRIGIDGGRPTVGNNDFKFTLQNVHGGTIAGLMGGTWGQPYLFSIAGIDVHVTPEAFAAAVVANGPYAPGAGFAETPLVIPNNPALIGVKAYFQYNYVDPVTDRLGSTQGTAITVGN